MIGFLNLAASLNRRCPPCPQGTRRAAARGCGPCASSCPAAGWCEGRRRWAPEGRVPAARSRKPPTRSSRSRPRRGGLSPTMPPPRARAPADTPAPPKKRSVLVAHVAHVLRQGSLDVRLLMHPHTHAFTHTHTHTHAHTLIHCLLLQRLWTMAKKRIENRTLTHYSR